MAQFVSMEYPNATTSRQPLISPLRHIAPILYTNRHVDQPTGNDVLKRKMLRVVYLSDTCKYIQVYPSSDHKWRLKKYVRVPFRLAKIAEHTRSPTPT